MSLQAAEQFEENGQYEEAYEEYKKVYAHNPNDLSLLAQLGHIAVMLKKTDDAETYYHKMLTLDATNQTAYEQLMDIYIDTDKYKYYVYRGNLHSIEQKYEHALHDFKKAVANAGDDHEAISSVRFILGTLYEQLGNPTKAIDEYLKVLDYDHSHEEVYTRLANLYVMDDVIGSAIETLERARKEGFDTENICENLAQLYLKNNTPEKACGAALRKRSFTSWKRRKNRVFHYIGKRIRLKVVAVTVQYKKEIYSHQNLRHKDLLQY